MNNNLRNAFNITAALLVSGFIFTACKPAEQTATPPPPTNAPAVVTPPATNAPAKPAVAAGTNAPAGTLTPEEAKNHIGENATVRGKVFGVHITAKGDAFLNVGGAYPNAPFTAVCFGGAIPADDLNKLNDKTVSFKGTIKEHNGKPEIILNGADQISE